MPICSGPHQPCRRDGRNIGNPQLKVRCNQAVDHLSNLSLRRIMCSGVHQPCRIDGHNNTSDKTVLQTAVSLRWSSESVFKAYPSASLSAVVLISHVDAIAATSGILELKVRCNQAVDYLSNLSLRRIMCSGVHQPCRIDGHNNTSDKTVL